MASSVRFILIFSLFSFLLAGCSQQEEAGKVSEEKKAPVQKELKVVVPDFVKGQWKSVKISVLDEETSKEEVYSVDIGGSFTIPGTALKVKVDTFLPAFTMDGNSMTSASNETHNPAARIIVTEEGKEVFTGWLFGLYPDNHAFPHPRYDLSLREYTPVKSDAGKKG